MRNLLKSLVAISFAVCIFGCSSGDKLDEKDSMESVLKDAQKNGSKDEPAMKSRSVKQFDESKAGNAKADDKSVPKSP